MSQQNHEVNQPTVPTLKFSQLGTMIPPAWYFEIPQTMISKTEQSGIHKILKYQFQWKVWTS